MIKILLGGSPCTHWSIAQTNNRETEASGQGWELFKNYLIAKEKFKPDFFLYENNKSASATIKNQISKELGVDLMYINSALVSAQNRERFYLFNGECEQPEDRGILLRDILESGIALREKSYCLDACYHKGGDFSNLKTQAGRRLMVAEPIRIGTIENAAKNPKHDSKQYRVYSPYAKSTTLCGNGGGVGEKTGLYAVPIANCKETNYEIIDGAEIIVTDRAIRQADNKGTKQGKYVYLPSAEKSNTVSAGQAHNEKVLVRVQEGQWKNVYKITGGQIAIKGKQYPINLPDGNYIIRKLTAVECDRLQTLPDNYTAGISDTQRYKCLGNGWTAEVIIHILKSILKDIPRDEKLLVLSMYDGIATGRYCLERLGFTDIEYHAYEIDKYAKQIELKNYPDIIQHGDAFEVRNSDWRICE